MGSDESDLARFDGSISKERLEEYLSRAVTHGGLLAADEPDTGQNIDEHARMLDRIGAKFIGRAAFRWWGGYTEEYWEQVAEHASLIHSEVGAEVMLQACLFETVHESVEETEIPAWVFEAFDQPVDDRTFDYDAIIYESGRDVDRWAEGLSVPDMSRPETKRWFYYRGVRYLDAGIEAIHFGQVHLMDGMDPGHEHWAEMLELLRAYAEANARRGLLLADAHTFGVRREDGLLFDFHSYPARMQELLDDSEVEQHFAAIGEAPNGEVLPAELKSNRGIYARSSGGMTPSGWETDALPYLIEVDNFGVSETPGEPTDDHFVWGYDEISWFARQPKAYRDEWLRYAHDWMAEHAPTGALQMPTNRTIGQAPVDREYEGESYTAGRYLANEPSERVPDGFGQEDTIASIWDD